MNQVQDMQVQLQRRAESDDEVMVALNKKVAEWKVRVQGRSLFQRQQCCFIAVIKLSSQSLRPKTVYYWCKHLSFYLTFLWFCLGTYSRCFKNGLRKIKKTL